MKVNIYTKYIWHKALRRRPRRLELGVWYKSSKAVSMDGFKSRDWNKNLVVQRSIGLNLIVWQVWFTFRPNNIFEKEIKDDVL